MGAGFGSLPIGNDTALLNIVTSTNIACGLHAGDWDVMAVAVAGDVGGGVHPVFPDLQGFCRRRMDIAGENLGNLVRHQLGMVRAIARAAGGQVQHIKLHGARSVNPEIIGMVLARTAQPFSRRAPFA
ncbi:LamB/YcsF family protein [Tropicimonas aquimaris]|uniref:LamB/YcsF family protein n=1 Tax=Tropicimonas aquimaris TaxID=914152 RepID=A0ABW3ITD5_9RHOB